MEPTHPLTLYRERHNMSQAALARAANTTRQSVHRVENGKQTPSMKLMAAFVAATNGEVSADDFLLVQLDKNT